MITITLLLAVLALIFLVASIMNKLPLWVSVLMLVLIHLLGFASR